jgi:hypothetical protein
MTALGMGGGFCQDPPAPKLGRAHMHTFGLCGTDVERPYINNHGRDIQYVGDGRVQNQNSITISNIKFQTHLF